MNRAIPPLPRACAAALILALASQLGACAAFDRSAGGPPVLPNVSATADLPAGSPWYQQPADATARAAHNAVVTAR
jgi:hypothetical protein